MSKTPLNFSNKKLTGFCQKNHIVFLALFGSVLTSRFSSASDVDVLVKFEKKHIPNLFDIAHMEEELTTIIGRRVDLKTPGDLSPYFRDDVLAKAKTLYQR
jgi:hypothetical protein